MRNMWAGQKGVYIGLHIGYLDRQLLPFQPATVAIFGVKCLEHSDRNLATGTPLKPSNKRGPLVSAVYSRVTLTLPPKKETVNWSGSLLLGDLVWYEDICANLKFALRFDPAPWLRHPAPSLDLAAKSN